MPIENNFTIFCLENRKKSFWCAFNKMVDSVSVKSVTCKNISEQ